LSAALERAVVEAPPKEAGRLFVEVVADGELADAMVEVRSAGGGDVLAAGRTYTGEATNPRALPVPAGTYDVHVDAVGIAGPDVVLAGIEVPDEGTVEHTADFSSGELAVGVRRNGALSDATIDVRAGDERVTSGRSYTRESNNPKVFRLPPGDYRVVLQALEFDSSGHRVTLEASVRAGERTEISHDYVSATLRVGSFRGDERLDSMVTIQDADGQRVAGGRTYTTESNNPKSFVLPPGSYRVEVKPLNPKGLGTKQGEVTLEGGGEDEVSFDFAG